MASLRELRKKVGVTQADLAAAIGTDQPQLSRLERAEDPRLRSIRLYVEALGGELVLEAVLADGTQAVLQLE